MELIRIEDIRYDSFCCCSCGTITVIAHDVDTPKLFLSGIPNGKEVYEKLRNSINSLQQSGRTQVAIAV